MYTFVTDLLIRTTFYHGYFVTGILAWKFNLVADPVINMIKPEVKV